jgi:nicotinamidase-related amidase
VVNNVIHDGTPEAKLMSEVDRRATDKLLHKHTYSGFYDTDLFMFFVETLGLELRRLLRLQKSAGSYMNPTLWPSHCASTVPRYQIRMAVLVSQIGAAALLERMFLE